MKAIENLLKISGSIVVELISAIDYDLDKKKFDWSLKRYDAKAIEISLLFEHMEYISIETSDILNVIFSNTRLYL